MKQDETRRQQLSSQLEDKQDDKEDVDEDGQVEEKLDGD